MDILPLCQKVAFEPQTVVEGQGRNADYRGGCVCVCVCVCV